MTVQETFIQADKQLTKVINDINDEQWDMEMPENFAISHDPKKKVTTLRDVITYHAYDEAWIPDMIAGKTMDEAGQDKFDGDLLGGTPGEKYAEYSQKAIAAVEALDDLGHTVHYTYGDYPADEALVHAITFRGLRAHDLAEVIGVDSDLPEELVKAMWELLKPRAEEYRKIGVFSPEVDVPEDAPLQDRLLGMTGRQP